MSKYQGVENKPAWKTESWEEAMELARRSYEEQPPAPLTPTQERAVEIFGRINPSHSQYRGD